MTQTHLFTQQLQDCRDKALVGGKAANLGRLLRLGFSVPGGFVVTTQAYRYSQEVAQTPVPFPFYVPAKLEPAPDAPRPIAPQILSVDVAAEIRHAYRAMGKGAVAVRSSATAEDMAAASMAGQYETFLDINGEEQLIDAVFRCWASIDSPRIFSYLSEHGIDPHAVVMAVVVQRLVPADVAGVLFTANPQIGTRSQMLIEASWGLGESVVSGRVQPDVLRLDYETGKVLSATIADKRVHLSAGAHAEREVEQSRRNLPCLSGRDVHELWQMGRRVAEHFGSPQDIEWAIHNGELYVLQSRPITTLDEAEAVEQVLRTSRERLREQTSAGHGPWALHNLAETMAHPSPLTWSIISHFMSGAGGFGAMYRQVGFEPSPAVDRDGFLELIGGRIYIDAARAPEMFFENFPFSYDLAELKRSPDASQNPPTIGRGTFMEKMRAARRLGIINANLSKLATDLDRKLNQETFPTFAQWCRKEKKRDLTSLTAEQLVELWRQDETRILGEFAPQSLLPSLISGMALGELRAFLAEHFWDDDPDELSQLISSGGPPNRTVIADAELFEVGKGTRTIDQWITDHGYRGAGEFDLAEPRWRECPENAKAMAALLAGGDGPMERHRGHCDDVNQRVDSLRSKLPPRDRAEFDRRIDLVRRYVAFREDGKDFLMLGYDLLRDLALEAGRRLDIGHDVFFLTKDDLFDAIRIGYAPLHLIGERKKAHAAESRLTLPRVIDPATIDALGEPPEVKSAGGYKAFAVSSGQAVGPARIRNSPTDAGELGSGYVLVCPSTDPSWTPLFVNAAALVLECGGTLSHGAVVAREMGLPAVVLPEATRMFAEGEQIQVDGKRGFVGRVDSDAVINDPAPSPPYSGEMAGVRGDSSSCAAPVIAPPTPLPGSALADAGNARPNQDDDHVGSALRTDSPGHGETVRSADPTLVSGVRCDMASGAVLSMAPHPNPLPRVRGRGSQDHDAIDPTDTHVAHALIPPPPGSKDKHAATIRNIAAIVWTIYLLAAFLLPATWIYDPSLRFLDLFLWPIARAWGKPAVVAIFAAGLAAITLILQKLITDNRRLLEAKRRAAALTAEAEKLPKESPRRAVLTALAGPVQWRTLAATMVPIGILLGPMVMTFSWMKERIDPASWNANAGTNVPVVATVHGELMTEVAISVQAPLALDAGTPASYKPAPIRETLQHLRLLLSRPGSAKQGPWELTAIPDPPREEIADLDAFLAQPIPPQKITWQLRAPEGLVGRFPITVSTPGQKPVTAYIVLGDQYAPSPATVDGPKSSAVRQVEIKYPPSKVERVFWRPLAFLKHAEFMPAWLVLYILAYLPTLFLLRALLKLP